MAINIVPTEPDPDEICELCGEVGRITLRPNSAEEAAGVVKVQLCHNCLNAHPEAQLLEDYVALARIRDIGNYHGYRTALIKGNKEIMAAIAEAKPQPIELPEATDPSQFLIGAKWEIVRLDDD